MKLANWRYATKVYTDKQIITIFRDDDLGLQRQEYLKRVWILPPRSRVFFFIDNWDEIFTDEVKMMTTFIRVAQYRRSKIHGYDRRVQKAKPDKI